MRSRSCKAKGRRLQQFVRDAILKAFPSLKEDDCRSCSMGNSGEDVQLSTRARELFNYGTECKSVNRINLHEAFSQAENNTKAGAQPLLVVKQDRKEPYAVIRFSHFMELVSNEKRMPN